MELQGPAPVSPDGLAAGFGRVLGRPVRAEAVARAEWEALFRAQGMSNPGPRIRMLDGFNEGWLSFEGAWASRRSRARRRWTRCWADCWRGRQPGSGPCLQ